MIENPSIHSLKLISDFGGRYLDKLLPSSDLNFSTNGAERPSKLDEKSFRTLLSACKNLHDLNLSACRLTNQNWIDLADGLSICSNLKRLSLGGGDFLFLQGAKALYLSFESNNSSLRELYVDGLNFGDYALLRFVKAIEGYKNFRKISLTNMNFGISKSVIVTIFEFCAGNPKLQYLSLGGAIFSNSDKLFRFYKPSSIDGRAISMVQSAVKAHQCLVVLDLAGCDMPDAEISQLIACMKDSSSLVELRTASNTMAEDDRSKLTAMTTRNRRNLGMRAATALSLLIGNAASQVDTWPQELTGVLVENAPLDALLDIAAVIDDRLDSVATDSDSSSADDSNSTDSGSSRAESSDSIAERSE